MFTVCYCCMCQRVTFPLMSSYFSSSVVFGFPQRLLLKTEADPCSSFSCNSLLLYRSLTDVVKCGAGKGIIPGLGSCLSLSVSLCSWPVTLASASQLFFFFFPFTLDRKTREDWSWVFHFPWVSQVPKKKKKARLLLWQKECCGLFQNGYFLPPPTPCEKQERIFFFPQS